MYFKPFALHQEKLHKDIIKEDKKNATHFGPCALGEEAIYLSSFYIDRFYYVPRKQVKRIFKRIAMTANRGFQMPYLVVSSGEGKEKQCLFHDEAELDQLLAALPQKWSEIPVGKPKQSKKQNKKAC